MKNHVCREQCILRVKMGHILSVIYHKLITIYIPDTKPSIDQVPSLVFFIFPQKCS
jgi:hypothetical protein